MTTPSHITDVRAAYDPDVAVHALRGPILLASDGRSRSDAAAIAARRAAARLGAPVEVVAVLAPMPPAYSLGYEVPVLPPDFDARRRDGLEADVRRRVEPVLGPAEGWPLVVRDGAPGRVIADVARERRAGLVVLGSGGHGPLDRLLGEEVSLQVVRRSSAPVLAVAPALDRPLRRAVAAVDFSAASIRAVQGALALLDPPAGEAGLLTLVHVRPPLEDRLPVPATWAAAYEASVHERFARLHELLRPARRDDVVIETRIRTGDVVDRVVEAARETGAELVALGTHGPGWVERLVVGSIATTALRRAGRSVLVAPAPGAADRVRLELRVAGQVTLTRPDDWGGALDAFTHRNLHRRARLEVNGPGVDGFVVGAEGYRFAGAAWDPHDRRVEIMLGEATDGARHLTHAVAHVRSIEIVAEDARRDHALLVEDAHGHAVLTLLG